MHAVFIASLNMNTAAWVHAINRKGWERICRWHFYNSDDPSDNNYRKTLLLQNQVLLKA